MANINNLFISAIINNKYLTTKKNDRSYCGKNSIGNIRSFITNGLYKSDQELSDFVVLMNGNKFFKDKKIISISPAGYYGFYVMGVCSYIRENYNISEYMFSGASAGAWNSLYMTLKENPEYMTNILIKNNLYANKNIYQIELEIKNRILQYYKTNEFELDRLFIGVTGIGKTNIYTDFENLEDALDCCIASSHIPFISGSIVHRYKNKYAFDGGFSSYPYLNTNKVTLHISPNMWNQNEKFRFNLFKRDYFDFEKLYERGYQDSAKYGKDILDEKLGNIVYEKSDL
jgi:hypothetical protein